MIHQITINQTTTKDELYDGIVSLVKAFSKSRNPELEPEQDKQAFILAMYQRNDKSDVCRCIMFRTCKKIDTVYFADYFAERIFESNNQTNK